MIRPPPPVGAEILHPVLPPRLKELLAANVAPPVQIMSNNAVHENEGEPLPTEIDAVFPKELDATKNWFEELPSKLKALDTVNVVPLAIRIFIGAVAVSVAKVGPPRILIADPELLAAKLTMLYPPAGFPAKNDLLVALVLVNESVDVFFCSVSPVTVLVSQVLPPLSSPTTFHVPDPIVMVRVLELLELKFPMVTFWLLALKMPCVIVSMEVVTAASTRRASASVTVAPVAPLTVRAPNL